MMCYTQVQMTDSLGMHLMLIFSVQFFFKRSLERSPIPQFTPVVLWKTEILTFTKGHCKV